MSDCDANCWVCGHKQNVHAYSDFDCEACGAAHEYEEGHCLALTEVKKLQASWPRPIPVSERLPELNEEVLWFVEGAWQQGGRDDDGYWLCGGPEVGYEASCPLDSRVTHWLPLPPDPTPAPTAAP